MARKHPPLKVTIQADCGGAIKALGYLRKSWEIFMVDHFCYWSMVRQGSYFGEEPLDIND